MIFWNILSSKSARKTILVSFFLLFFCATFGNKKSTLTKFDQISPTFTNFRQLWVNFGFYIELHILSALKKKKISTLSLIIMRIQWNSSFSATKSHFCFKILDFWWKFHLKVNYLCLLLFSLSSRIWFIKVLQKRNLRLTIYAWKYIKFEGFSNRFPDRHCKLLQPDHIKMSRRTFEFNASIIKTLIHLEPFSKSYIKVLLRFLKLASFRPLANKESVTFS